MSSWIKTKKNKVNKLSGICGLCEGQYLNLRLHWKMAHGIETKRKEKTVGQVIKEIEELEPQNIIDYILKGSGLNQWRKLNE